jgi:hypothetical protein
VFLIVSLRGTGSITGEAKGDRSDSLAEQHAGAAGIVVTPGVFPEDFRDANALSGRIRGLGIAHGRFRNRT